MALGVFIPSLILSKADAESGDWSSPGLNAKEDETMPRFVRMDNGVKYQVLADTATGEAAQDLDLVEFNYVLRRPNGYFIYSCTSVLAGAMRNNTVIYAWVFYDPLCRIHV
eukprot:scaffold257868_cov49-Prasinocladus_malaysianus.AAC.1